MTQSELKQLEDCACPGCVSCSGMYTANSMKCVTEALGLGIPGNGTIPAVQAARHRLAKYAGMKIIELYKKDIKPRDIKTLAGFRNVIAVDMALGCSTNTVLHIPAIAHEAGIKLNLDLFNEVSEKTPNLCKLSPVGNHHIEDFDSAAGIQTVTGKSVEANLKNARFLDETVSRPINNPYS
jgi:dihydroxy-acid dehydratase